MEMINNNLLHRANMRISMSPGIKCLGASHMVLVVKNPPANAGDACSVPGSGRFPGGGHGNSLQYSCLENPTDRGRESTES